MVENYFRQFVGSADTLGIGTLCVGGLSRVKCIIIPTWWTMRTREVKVSLSVNRQRVVFPSMQICRNCANYDPQFRCPQQMKYQLCTSFEIVDPGDVEVEEEMPYVRETLGSSLEGETKEKVDVEVDGAWEIEVVEDE
jgi:hypothetical protein